MEWNECLCAPQIQMLNTYPTVCLYLGMRIQRQWLKSNEFIRVGPWSYMILIRRDTRESCLSPSPSLHFSLSSSFSLSLSFSHFLSLSLSMWGHIKKLAVSKPGRDLLGETNPAIHFASRTDRRQMSLVCWSCPVWDCVTGVQDGKDSMYQQAQNKFLGNRMGVRRRFRRK